MQTRTLPVGRVYRTEEALQCDEHKADRLHCVWLILHVELDAPRLLRADGMIDLAHSHMGKPSSTRART